MCFETLCTSPIYQFREGYFERLGLGQRERYRLEPSHHFLYVCMFVFGVLEPGDVLFFCGGESVTGSPMHPYHPSFRTSYQSGSACSRTLSALNGTDVIRVQRSVRSRCTWFEENCGSRRPAQDCQEPRQSLIDASSLRRSAHRYVVRPLRSSACD